jgi:hypothetical protein
MTDGRRAATVADEHAIEVPTELGYDSDHISRLAQRGAIKMRTTGRFTRD